MPWGMDFGFPQFNGSEQPQQDFSFPVQDFRQSSFAQGMNGESPYASLFGGGNTPAISRYQEYLGSTPNRSDYQPGIMGKILASIAGLSAGINNPSAGVQTSLGIMDIPYQRALEQYKIEEPGLRNAASIEERQLNDKNAFMRQIQQGEIQRSQQQMMTQHYQDLLEQQRAVLAQTASRDAANAANQSIDNTELARHQRAMEDFQAQQLAASQQNAETNRLQAENQRRKDLMGYELSDISSPSGGTFSKIGGNQDEGFMRMQLENALKSDPMFKGAWTDRGFNLGAISMTPELYSRYQQYIQQFTGSGQ